MAYVIDLTYILVASFLALWLFLRNGRTFDYDLWWRLSLLTAFVPIVIYLFTVNSDRRERDKLMIEYLKQEINKQK